MMSIGQDKEFLRHCIVQAVQSVEHDGGPFAAMVVRNGQVVAHSGNCVTQKNDPTAHAEVEAIRQAAALLETPHLSDCVLYASCEPCPMCMAAAMWAHIPRVVYAATHNEAIRAGFDDTVIAGCLYGQAAPKSLPPHLLKHIELEEASAPFDAWLAKADRKPY